MKSKINLFPFCDEHRESIIRPFTDSGFVYATNGRVIVRTNQGIEEYKPSEMAPIKIINTFPWGKTEDELIIMPVFPTQKEEYADCEECKGAGKLEFHTIDNEYECDCKGCDGDGKLLNARQIELDNAYFDYDSMMLVSKLPNVKYYSGLSEIGLHFFFDNGEGFIKNVAINKQPK